MHSRAYHRGVDFEWDARKAEINRRKHGIDFADAATVLLDELALTIAENSGYEEARFVSLGADALGRCLVVVFTWRGDVARLISARRATRGEHRRYGGER